ncbi:MAG: diguanylate cyclase [Polyangiaceae bacterium]
MPYSLDVVTSSRSPRPSAPSPLALIATRIVAESLKPDPCLAELSDMARSDAGFAVRLIATVNSGAFGLRRQVSDVMQAISLLGTRGVRNIGLGLAISDMVPANAEARVLLANSLRRAVAARAIAERMGLEKPDELFSVGLFLEVGLLSRAREDLAGAVELARRPAAHRPVFERAVGLECHGQVGARIAREFQLPEAVQAAIREHHARVPPSEPISRLAWVAERVAAAFEAGDVTKNCALGLEALALVGIQGDAAAEVFERVPKEAAAAAVAFDRDIGPQSDLDSLARDAQRSLVELNVEYEAVIQRLEQIVAEKEQLALELQHANERLSTQAATDELTGLLNKRAFTEAMARDFARARRAGTPISLVMADLDWFKRLNDTRGHLAGDALLRALGPSLTASVRGGDVVGRFGGEEFVLLLPNTEIDHAMIVAERVRRAAEALVVPFDGEPIRCTLSVGVAVSDAGAGTPDQLLERADAALYAAKHAGKNCVRRASGERGGLASRVA